MASKALVVVFAAGLALTTAACDKIKSKLSGQPGGQVVATVNGEEITRLQLRSELGGFSSSDPKIMKMAQDQALQQIVIRSLLAQKAKDQKLDRLPGYSMQVWRGERTLLAQLYESKLFGSVAPPTRQEAETYIANNPDKFAKRRIWVLDTVILPANQVAKEKIPGIKSIEQLRALLDSQNTSYQDTIITVDTLTADQDAIKSIEKLPPGEVFVYRQGNADVFNRITQTRDAPFRGELAVAYAKDALRKIQAEDFIRTQLLGIRRAAESTVTYSKGFKPDNPDFGIAPVKGAPGAPTEEKAPSGPTIAAPEQK
jgi:EpsD family peptidyl-prolyl cis-trans isomerase